MAASTVSTELRAALFHGFGDRSRLLILGALVSGERRVTDIIATTGLTQSNASTHLACLWDCGLVARERRGREVYYRLIDGVADVFAAPTESSPGPARRSARARATAALATPRRWQREHAAARAPRPADVIRRSG